MSSTQILNKSALYLCVMKTIMIVDDHANVRTLVKEYLAESSVSIAPTRRARRKPAAPGWDLQV